MSAGGADSTSGRPPVPRLVVLSGPSGVGKTTVVRQLRRSFPQVWVSVSATTRYPRPGEVDGVNYFFLNRADFEDSVARGHFMEWAEFAGNLYGTPRQPVLDRLAAGTPVLLEIELDGARQIRDAHPDALFVFLEPPTWDVLERRLVGRGTEAPDVIAARLDRARTELAAASEFDVRLVNDDVQRVCESLVTLLGSGLVLG